MEAVNELDKHKADVIARYMCACGNMSNAEFGSKCSDMILTNGLLVSTKKAEGVARVFVP